MRNIFYVLCTLCASAFLLGFALHEPYAAVIRLKRCIRNKSYKIFWFNNPCLFIQLYEAFEEIATDRVLDVFRVWDKNNGGTISRGEFGKAMAALGLKTTKAELNKLFNEIDVDHSGEISYQELRQAVVDHDIRRSV